MLLAIAFVYVLYFIRVAYAVCVELIIASAFLVFAWAVIAHLTCVCVCVCVGLVLSRVHTHTQTIESKTRLSLLMSDVSIDRSNALTITCVLFMS